MNEDNNNEYSHIHDYYEKLLCAMEPYYDEIQSLPESCRPNRLNEISLELYEEFPMFDKGYILYTLLENMR